MKNILFYLLSFIFLINILSCKKDFLDTSSPSSLSEETVFANVSMAKAAVMGLYAKMTDTYIYGQKLSVNWQGVTDIESNGSFNVNNYNSTTSDYGAGNYYDNVYNRTTTWTSLYELAELSTTAIQGIRNSPILEKSSDQMKPLLGEALVLRALAYFNITRYWGDVPFKRVPSKSDLSNVYMGRTNRDTIYKYLVKDLQEAVSYLPWLNANSEYSTVERITKGFAKGLLARIALFAGGWSLRDGNTFPNSTAEHNKSIPEMNGYFVGRPENWEDYYKIAVTQCAEMIGNPDNPHHLDPSYKDIWKNVCEGNPNPYNENLFEVAFGLGQNGDIGSLFGYPVDGNSKYGTRGFGGSYVTSTAYYFYSFDKNDKRRDVTLTWFHYSSDNKEEISTDPLNVHFNKWRIYWMPQGYLNLFKTANSRIATGVNWILMRYSDVLLMFAEAKNELAGPDAVDPIAGISARQALEKVRQRAFGPGSPKIKAYSPDFFKAIVNERAWEFGCESIRKQDLIRWGLLTKKIEAMKKALCLMFDHKRSVTIFGKTYPPSHFPEKVYYRYKDKEYIDPNSLNYYGDLPADPGGDYHAVTWFPALAEKSSTNNRYLSWPVSTLVTATGLNPSYDYTAFLSKLTNGSEIKAELIQHPMGNQTCYYRYPYAIYYKDILESDGHLENAYGH